MRLRLHARRFRRRSSPLSPLRFLVRTAPGIGLLALLALSLLGPRARGAAPANVDAATEEVSKQLMDPCPECKGKLLAGCECTEAREAKDQIRSLLQEGKSEAEVIQVFRARYGEWVLAVPEQKGFNRLGYVLPAGLFAAGAVAIALFLRRAVPRRSKASPGGSPWPASSPDSDRDSLAEGSSVAMAASGSNPVSLAEKARKSARPGAGPSVLTASERTRLEHELRSVDR